jgi:hypothetical protein
LRSKFLRIICRFYNYCGCTGGNSGGPLGFCPKGVKRFCRNGNHTY